MRAIRPPAPSITRLTASNDTGACEIYETPRPTLLTSLLDTYHFSSLRFLPSDYSAFPSFETRFIHRRLYLFEDILRFLLFSIV